MKTIDQRMKEWAALSEEWKEGYNYWYDEANPDPDENPYDVDSVENAEWYKGYYYAYEEHLAGGSAHDDGVADDEPDDEDGEDVDGN